MTSADPRIQRLQACKSELAAVEITHAGDAWWELKRIFKERVDPLVRRFVPERLSEHEGLRGRVLFHVNPPDSNGWEHRDPEWLKIVEKLQDDMTTFLDSLCDILELESEVLGSRDVRPGSIPPTGPDAVAIKVGEPNFHLPPSSGLTQGRFPDRGELTRNDARRMRKLSAQPLSVPDGTQWEKIIIEFVNPEVVRIRAPGFEENLTFEELGFRNRGKSHAEPRPLWELLLLLAKREGRMQWDSDTPFDPDSRPNIKKRISDLRRHLKSLFPNVLGDPFKSYRKVRGYETAFRIQLAATYRDDSR